MWPRAILPTCGGNSAGAVGCAPSRRRSKALFGKVAETPGAVEFGWPIKLTEPLEVTQGGTGANSGASACANIGAVKRAATP